MATKITVPAVIAPPDAGLLDKLLIQGDLTRLTPDQKLAHYTNMCAAFRLNPMTQPFLYLILNNKTVLYATKTCTDQLRKNFNISVRFTSRNVVDDGATFEVVVEATDYTGREDTASGVMSLMDKNGKKMTGEALANARMKAETKAKRRVTLSIVGLGMLDESELDTVREAQKLSWSDAMGSRDGTKVTWQEWQQLCNEASEKAIDGKTLCQWANVDTWEDVTGQMADLLRVQIKLHLINQKGDK